MVEREAQAFHAENRKWLDLLEKSAVPSSYKGPTLPSPPTAESMAQLVAALTLEPDRPLHQKYLLPLLLGCKRQWTQRQGPGFRGQTAAPVVDVDSPPSGTRLIVVGDTHGQLQDVLWIFAEYGPPSPTNWYIFNGDVADRGDYSCEIFALLFGYMLPSEADVHSALRW